MWHGTEGLHYPVAGFAVVSRTCLAVIFGGGVGQRQSQLLEQHAVLGLGLGVAREQQFAPVGGGDAHVYHLHRLELGKHLARCDAAGQRAQLRLERDLQAVGEEGDEDVRLDARFLVVMIGLTARSCLSSLKACSTSVS